MELYKKHRPKKLSDVFGNASVIDGISKKIKHKELPQSILLCGDSGTGKTTLARIIARMLKCNPLDLKEINCASFRGIDTIREIQRNSGYAPKGKARVWILDEVHMLSRDGQTALLKTLEDTPKRVYFILATTDPQKLLKTIRTRCTEYKMSKLKNDEMKDLIASVCGKEQIEISDEVGETLIEKSDGSPRKVLVLLDKIALLENSDSQLEAIENSDVEAASLDLARAIFKRDTTWSDICLILKNIQDEPEMIRRVVLGYAKSVLLSGNKQNGKFAAYVISLFSDNFYDSGLAGLSAACFLIFEK